MKRWIGLLLTVMLLVCLLPVTAETNEPSSTGDGLMPRSDVLKLIRWIDLGYCDGMEYEDVVAVCGVEGLDKGNKGPNSMTALGDHYFDWIAKDDPTHYIHVCFRGQESTGAFILKQWNTSGFRSEEWENADLTDWLIASACRETTEVSADLQRFSNPVVTVSAMIPAAGWVKETWGSNQLQFYKGTDTNSAPCIQIAVYDVPAMFDFYIDQYEDICPVDSRIIAGVEMEGRAYHYRKMDWVEYSAVLEDNIAVAVQINETALSSGVPGTEAYDVLSSLSFAYTDMDGKRKVHDMSSAPRSQPEVTPEPVQEPEPVPAETPAPVVPPEEIAAAPAPASSAPPILEEGVERFAELPGEIPENWESHTFTNEKTGVSLSVCIPLDEELGMTLKVYEPSYDMQDHLAQDMYYSVGDVRGKSYWLFGLYTTDSEREFQKYLDGADMAREYDTCTYELIQNEYGTVMNKITKVSADKLQYCALSPLLEDGTRVILKVTLSFVGDFDAKWFLDICDAFERTAAFTVEGIEVPHTSREEIPAAEETEMPETDVTPVPVNTEGPAETSAPAFDGAADYTGEWYCVYIHTGGMDLTPALYGLDIKLVLRADGTSSFNYPDPEESTWGEDADGVLRHSGTGHEISLQSDGTLVLGNYESGYMIFSKDASYTAVVFPQPKAAQTPAPAAGKVSAPGDAGVEYGVKYTAVTYETNGISMDASMMGAEYSILFREDGTCDFVMAGVPVENLSWQPEGDDLLVDYCGAMIIRFAVTDGGLDMDYFGSGIMKMIKE